MYNPSSTRKVETAYNFPARDTLVCWVVTQWHSATTARFFASVPIASTVGNELRETSVSGAEEHDCVPVAGKFFFWGLLLINSNPHLLYNVPGTNMENLDCLLPILQCWDPSWKWVAENLPSCSPLFSWEENWLVKISQTQKIGT